MKQGQALNIFAVTAVVLTAAGGWHFREPLGQTLGKSIVEPVLKSVGRVSPMPAGPGGYGQGSAQAWETASASDSAPAPAHETVYRWVDANGVTHYDQQGGAGRDEVALDPGRIQRLEDLSPASPTQP